MPDTTRTTLLATQEPTSSSWEWMANRHQWFHHDNRMKEAAKYMGTRKLAGLWIKNTSPLSRDSASTDLDILIVTLIGRLLQILTMLEVTMTWLSTSCSALLNINESCCDSVGARHDSSLVLIFWSAVSPKSYNKCVIEENRIIVTVHK
jgi:hypothetical protein